MKHSIASQSSEQPNKEKANKAEAILAGALQVFTTQGYAAASMDRIATAAGVSKPTLYSYFRDKKGLFVALIQQLTQNSSRAIFSLQADPDGKIPPEQVLRQMANLVLEELSSNKPLLALMRLIIGESGRFPDLSQTFVREITKPLLERLTAYLAAHPQLNLPDPAIAARIFAGALVYYVIVQNVMQGDEILPLEGDRLVEGLVQMMAAHKTQPLPQSDDYS